MSVGGLSGLLPPHLADEAMRLFFEILDGLHAVEANKNGVLFALPASPQLADALAVFAAASENDEDDGQAEDDARLAPAVIEALLAPAPLQGHPVPLWSPPDMTSTQVTQPPEAVARIWPDLARRPSEEA